MTTSSTIRLLPPSWEALEAMAAAVAVSRDVFIEELIAMESQRVDDHGRPTWWPHPVPEHEELPLSQSA